MVAYARENSLIFVALSHIYFFSMTSYISPDKDPLGQAVRDYMKGEREGEIHVTSDIAVDDVIPVPYLFRTWEEMPQWEQKAMDLVYGKVLDVGAGTGVHSLIMQERGREVVPIDISPGAVEVMRQRGLVQAQQAQLEDMSKASFDTIFLMMNGIGIVGDLDRLATFLSYAHEVLKPDGQILLDSSDLIYLFSHEITIDDKLEFSIPFPQDRYYGIITYEMKYKNMKSDPFQWLYIDFQRLENIAFQCGFHCQQVMQGSHFEYLARLSLRN